MRGAAGAFAWEFGRRLRAGAVAIAAYLLGLAIAQLLLGSRSPIRPSNEMTFAFTITIPLTAAFFFVLAVFANGLRGDLTARPSMYPARLFTLPVSTAALAGYPMLYGSLTMASLWGAWNLVALRPGGVQFPFVWPALFGAAFLAWVQVLTWMPFGLRGLRAIVAVLSLFVFDGVVFAAIELRLRESSMIALLAPQLPLAYLAARMALARARRGEVPDWRGTFARPEPSAGASSRLPADRSFSAARAQAWFEWREHGRSLPTWVAVVLPFAIGLAYLVRHEPPVLRFTMLAAMLLAPPFVAAFVALTVGQSRPDGVDSYGVTAFAATRPLSTARLITAKLEMAAASTLLSWLLVALAVPLGLAASGTWPIVVERARRVVGVVGLPRTVAIGLLTVAVLLAWTWKQLVQGLAIGLTGRQGLIKGSVVLRLGLLVALGLGLHVLGGSRPALAALWVNLPWILAALVVIKLGAAGEVARRLARHRLIALRALWVSVVAWLGVVLGIYGLLGWVFAGPHFPRYVLLLIAVLAVPLLRPLAATLALAWNRHRGPGPFATVATTGLSVLLVVLALPAAMAVGEAAAFHLRNRNNGALTSSGESREYLLYVPKSYDPARPTSLVISMHGAGMWPAAQRDVSQWNAVADQYGFLVVYPSGARRLGPRVWRTENDPEGRADVRFLADLIDRLTAGYNIDPRRIYADGLSNGGGMAFVLSCTLSDRIAAVGLVASAQLLPWSGCTDPRPVPMIAFHGTDDRFAPYLGGTSWVAPAASVAFPAIPTFAASWARRNRCHAAPVESMVAPDVTRREYTGCSNDATVSLYTIHEGGHTWPGGDALPAWFAGRTSAGVNASREEWAFFQAHPLVRESP
jgi:polyhydroxybutyrate depolymerase